MSFFSSAVQIHTYNHYIPRQQKHHSTGENGKTSSSKRTRHLNLRDYFVTDQVKKSHLKVEFCPTQDILADFFTQPPQGALFIHMHEKILSLFVSTNPNIHWSVLENQKVKENDTAARDGKIKDTENHLKNGRLRQMWRIFCRSKLTRLG